MVPIAGPLYNEIERLYSHPLERGDINVYLMVWQRGGALLSDTCYPTDIYENPKISMKKERYICHFNQKWISIPSYIFGGRLWKIRLKCR